MKNLIFVCTLFITNQVFAQVDFRKEYYPAVNRAEMAITKDDYQTAFTEYQTAFLAVKTPLARDIFNAVACKFLLNDFEGAKPLLLKLAKKGIAEKVLERKEVFGSLNIKEKWIMFKPIYNDVLNETLIEVLSSIDQKIKVNKDSIDFYLNMPFDYQMVDLGKGLQYYNFDKIDSLRLNDVYYKKALPYYTTQEVELLKQSIKGQREKFYQIRKELLLKKLRNEGFKDEFENIHPDSKLSVSKFYAALEQEDYTLLRKPSNDSLLKLTPINNLNDIEKGEILKYMQLAIIEGELNPFLAFSKFCRMENLRSEFLEVFRMKVDDYKNCVQLEKDIGFFIVKPKLMSDYELLQFQENYSQFGLDNLNNLKVKELYAKTKNSSFLFLYTGNIEERAVPNCEIAQKMLVGATIIQD
jgi:hypothetical protein